MIIIRTIYISVTYRCYLSRGDSGHTDHPPELTKTLGNCACYLFVYYVATLLLVKDTGKGKKG